MREKEVGCVLVDTNERPDPLGGRETEQYRRLGAWHAARGEAVEALRAYYKAGLDEAVVELLARRGGSEYYDLAREEIDRTFERVSMDRKLCYPIAYLTYLHDKTMIDDTGQAAAEVMAMKARYEQDETLAERTEILGEIALIESFFYFNDARCMARYHQKARLYLGNRNSRIFGPEMIFTFGAGGLLYLYHKSAGELRHEVEAFVAGVGDFMKATNGCGAGSEYLIQTEWALETGRWEECRALAERTEYRAASRRQDSILLSLLLLRLRLARALGEETARQKALDRLNALRSTWADPLLQTGADLVLAYMGIPTEYMGEGAPGAGGVLLQCEGWQDIVFGRTLLRRGRYIELEVHGDAMLLSVGAENHVMVRLHGLLYRAAALAAQGSTLAARKNLQLALNLAEEDEIILPFAELGAALLPTLTTLDMRCPFHRKVLAACQSYPKANEPAADCGYGAAELTGTEQKVCELVVQGYKQREIGKLLCISTNTVKSHLRHIHQKLGVSTRANLVDKYSKIKYFIHNDDENITL